MPSRPPESKCVKHLAKSQRYARWVIDMNASQAKREICEALLTQLEEEAKGHSELLFKEFWESCESPDDIDWGLVAIEEIRQAVAREMP